MSGADAFFLSIPAWFTPGINMAVTKAAGIACSFADIAFILILLRTAHALKGPDAPPPRKRVLTLCVFAALTPTLALPLTSDAFTIWQSLILGLPYLMLAHAVVTEFPTLLRHLREKIRPGGGAGG